MNDTLRRQVEQLTHALIEGDISADDHAQLDQLVRSDTDALDTYLSYINLHAALGRVQTPDVADAKTESEEQHVSRKRSAVGLQQSAEKESARTSTQHATPLTPRPSFRTFVRRHNLAVAIAVAFVAVSAIVAWMAFSYLPGVATDTDQPSATDRDQVIAWLIDTQDVVWAGGGALNTQYRAGARLVFETGLVAIRYATGAKVLIEGPAEYVVGTRQEAQDGSAQRQSRSRADVSNAGFLRRGTLVARIDSHEAKGFTIFTHNSTIEDLGTEFGVIVNDEGRTRVRMFEGRASVVARGSNGTGTPRLLNHDEELLIMANGRIDDSGRLATGRDRFAKLMAHRFEAANDAAHARYREVVLASKPVAYWPFDDQKDDVLIDVVRSRPVRPHGGLESLARDNSQREPGALLFDGSDDFAEVALDKNYGTPAFSVEAWAKPRVATQEFQAIVSNREDVLGLGIAGYVLYVTPDHQWEVWLGGSHGPGRGNDWQQVVGTDVRFDRWTHVAATFEPTGDAAQLPVEGTARLYINGKLAGSETCRFRPNDKRALFIGGVLESNVTPNYRFDGNLAHVAIYDRALSEEEIQDHFTMRRRAE